MKCWKLNGWRRLFDRYVAKRNWDREISVPVSIFINVVNRYYRTRIYPKTVFDFCLISAVPIVPIFCNQKTIFHSQRHHRNHRHNNTHKLLHLSEQNLKEASFHETKAPQNPHRSHDISLSVCPREPGKFPERIQSDFKRQFLGNHRIFR
jgi:hypothetical protein